MDGQRCVEATSTLAVSASLKMSVGSMVQDNRLSIKEEPCDTDLDIEPTELQHIHYGANQPDMTIVKQESTINYNNIHPMLCARVKKEITEDEWRDSLTAPEELMKDPGMCRTLQCLQYKLCKDQLEAICRVQLKRLDTFRCEVCGVLYADKHRLGQHLLLMHQSHSQASPYIKSRKAYKQKRRAADMKWQRSVGAKSKSAKSKSACRMVQEEGFNIKEESDDTDLDIGPTLLQHMETYTWKQQKHNRNNQQNTSVVTEEYVNVDDDDDLILSNEVKEESAACESSEEEIDVVSFDENSSCCTGSSCLRLNLIGLSINESVSDWSIPQHTVATMGERRKARQCGTRSAAAYLLVPRKRSRKRSPLPPRSLEPRKRGRRGRRVPRPSPVKRGRPASNAAAKRAEAAERDMRNEQERQRRCILMNLFYELQREVPSIRDKEHVAKVTILRKAETLCRQLAAKEHQHQALLRRRTLLLSRVKKLRLMLNNLQLKTQDSQLTN